MEKCKIVCDLNIPDHTGMKTKGSTQFPELGVIKHLRIG